MVENFQIKYLQFKLIYKIKKILFQNFHEIKLENSRHDQKQVVKTYSKNFKINNEIILSLSYMQKYHTKTEKKNI